MERDRKNFEKMDFCSYPTALLIDSARGSWFEENAAG